MGVHPLRFSAGSRPWDKGQESSRPLEKGGGGAVSKKGSSPGSATEVALGHSLILYWKLCSIIRGDPQKGLLHLLHVFFVFTVTPSEIKMQTIQCRKSGIGEMKEDKYTKSLAKNQVCVRFHWREIWKNVSPKFIKICMEMPCWCPFEGYKYGRRKPTKTSFFEFFYKYINLSLEEFIKIKVIFILRQGMFR